MSQERMVRNDQSSEQCLGVQLSNEDERRIRKEPFHEKKDETKKENRNKIFDMIKHVKIMSHTCLRMCNKFV